MPIKYEKAIDELHWILDNQQTVSIKRLQSLLTDANISLESSESKEVRFLRGEIRNLHKALKRKDEKIKALEERLK